MSAGCLKAVSLHTTVWTFPSFYLLPGICVCIDTHFFLKVVLLLCGLAESGNHAPRASASQVLGQHRSKLRLISAFLSFFFFFFLWLVGWFFEMESHIVTKGWPGKLGNPGWPQTQEDLT